MDGSATRIPYRQTGFFSSLILDYLDNAPALSGFYQFRPDVEGLKQSIAQRQQAQPNREILVQVLRKQYEPVRRTVETEKNIAALANDTTFTVTTAHQPALFTGPLFFIYKILHVIRLADSCKTLFPEYDFVPVYYMGSEDADLDELGHFYINEQKRQWLTAQKGAVGRMKVDKALLGLIEDISGEISVLPHGDEMLSLIREFYREGTMMQEATFELINALFGEYGLVVLIPDNPELKRQALPVFEDDLFQQSAARIVEQTAAKLRAAGYKVQAHPREINLFYLENGVRNRIVPAGAGYEVHGTSLSFSKEAIRKELKEYPGRFSPNVILRGIFQGIVLPDIAFIGGGGELAYWLQLKELFQHYKVPFPVLVLRNSFAVVEEKWQEKVQGLELTAEDIFQPEEGLLNKIVEKNSHHDLHLNEAHIRTANLYDEIARQAASVDSTLRLHVEALKTKTLHRLKELEKKMLRAEKRKFDDHQRQLAAVKRALFPAGNLQERIENFMPFYAKWGAEFIRSVYQHSLALEQEFVVLHMIG